MHSTKTFPVLLSVALCVTIFAGCNVRVVEPADNKVTDVGAPGQTSLFFDETVTSSKDDDSWKTATLGTEPTQTTIVVSSDTATSSVITSVPDTVTTEVTATQPIETEVTAPPPETDTSETSAAETQEKFRASFKGEVLEALRKYIIVKPEIGTEEFELSRRIIVYCKNAVDFEAGDNVEVDYSGSIDEEKEDMPVISTAKVTKTAASSELPDFLKNTHIFKAEVIRVYNDGFLGKICEDSREFSEGDKVNVFMTDSDKLDKGYILEIHFKGSVEEADDDYKSVECDDFKLIFAPSNVEGIVSSVNDKGIVLKYTSGTIDAPEGTDIIIISEKLTNLIEGDVIKVIFTDDISTEPYIIYNVSSFSEVN